MYEVRAENGSSDVNSAHAPPRHVLASPSCLVLKTCIVQYAAVQVRVSGGGSTARANVTPKRYTVSLAGLRDTEALLARARPSLEPPTPSPPGPLSPF